MVRDAYYAVIGVALIISFATASLLIRGTDKFVWRNLTLAALFWATGDIVHRSYELYGIFNAPRDLLMTYLFYLAAYIALAGVVSSLARAVGGQEKRVTRINYFLPLLLIEAPVVAFILATFLPRGISVSSTTVTVTLPVFIEYMLPAFDIGILAVILYIFFTKRLTDWRTSYELIIFGLMLFTVADICFSLLRPAGIFDLGNFPSLAVMYLWILGYSLLGLAVIYRLTEPAEEIAGDATTA